MTANFIGCLSRHRDMPSFSKQLEHNPCDFSLSRTLGEYHTNAFYNREKTLQGVHFLLSHYMALFFIEEL